MAAPIGRYKNIIWFWGQSEPSFAFIRQDFLLALHSCSEKKKKKKSYTPPTQYPALVMLKKIHRAPGAHIQPARSDWSASTYRHMALFRGSLASTDPPPARSAAQVVPSHWRTQFTLLCWPTWPNKTKRAGYKTYIYAATYRQITSRLLFRCIIQICVELKIKAPHSMQAVALLFEGNRLS